MKNEWLIYKEAWKPTLPEIQIEPNLKDPNGNGIIPTNLVDYFDQRFIEFGYMTTEALDASKETGRVVLWSIEDQELKLVGDKFPLLITGWRKDPKTNSLIVFASR